MKFWKNEDGSFFIYYRNGIEKVWKWILKMCGDPEQEKKQ